MSVLSVVSTQIKTLQNSLSNHLKRLQVNSRLPYLNLDLICMKKNGKRNNKPVSSVTNYRQFRAIKFRK